MIAEVNTESKIFMLKEYVDILWNHVYTIDKKISFMIYGHFVAFSSKTLRREFFIVLFYLSIKLFAFIYACN